MDIENGGRLLTTGMYEFPFENDVPVLKITQPQTGGEISKTDTKIWHCLPGNDGAVTLNPTLTKVLQM